MVPLIVEHPCSRGISTASSAPSSWESARRAFCFNGCVTGIDAISLESHTSCSTSSCDNDNLAQRGPVHVLVDSSQGHGSAGRLVAELVEKALRPAVPRDA